MKSIWLNPYWIAGQIDEALEGWEECHSFFSDTSHIEGYFIIHRFLCLFEVEFDIVGSDWYKRNGIEYLYEEEEPNGIELVLFF